MSSSGLATQVCDIPLLRADVTQLDSLGEAPFLEDEGPLGGCHLLTQDACDSVTHAKYCWQCSGLVKMSAI